MKTLKPYIGICDFTNNKQVLEMLDIISKYRHADVKLMIGAMTSYKVFNYKETKWAEIFPKLKNLKNIFSIRDPLLVNCIHYADYENNTGLGDILCRLVNTCGDGLSAIQLDMIWPPPRELEIFQRQHALPIIMQVSRRSMTECHDNPIAVAKKIRDDYGGLVSAVLIDCSMGKGLPINVPFIEGYIESIKTYAGDVEIAIAGGLGPDTVHRVQRLIKEYRVSIDAQSKLRISGKAEDPIDWELAKKYVHNAIGYYL